MQYAKEILMPVDEGDFLDVKVIHVDCKFFFDIFPNQQISAL